jgi:hypothetical protein
MLPHRCGDVCLGHGCRLIEATLKGKRPFPPLSRRAFTHGDNKQQAYTAFSKLNCSVSVDPSMAVMADCPLARVWVISSK